MVDPAAVQVPGRRKRGVAALVLILLVTALTGAGVAAARTGLASRAAAQLPWASTPAPCDETDVRVVAAPDALTVVNQIVAPIEGRVLPDGTCLRVDVQGEAPARTVGRDGAGSDGAPQLWVPDSSLWARQVQSWALRPVGSLGTSPVVVAGIKPTLRRLGWFARTPTWPEALNPDRRIAAPSMTDEAASLLALLALGRSLGPGPQTEQAVVGVVLAASRAQAPDLPAAAALARSPKTDAPIVLTSRRGVAQLNQDPQARHLIAVQPAGLPAMLDYPVLRVGRSGEDPVVTAGTDLVVAALRAPEAARIATAAGFGPPSAAVTPTTPQGVAAAAKAAAQVDAFVQQVRVQAIPTRMLILMDASRSMAQPVQPGLSRSRLASQAAKGAGRLLPDNSAIGLWAFAGNQTKRRPYWEVARIDELGAPDGGKPHRAVINDALKEMPFNLSAGGTALYDTTLAAVRTVRESYDPNATNAVVIFTDGANDYPDGISLSDFQQAVRADAKEHPKQPIVLVAIGIGPEADSKALAAMTAPVGGRSYRADTPEALRTVLFDSIAHRVPRARS